MERKIKVAAVSYLNTKPLLYGIENFPIKEQIELSVDYPAKIGQQLIDNEVDLGLIPVALIPQLPEYHVITNYCIGAEGAVGSVFIFSEAPIEEIKAIYLDYQSRSSVALSQFLMREHWKVNPALLKAEPGFEQKIGGTTAAVIIGDRALKQLHKNKYVYDLGEYWVKHTGLPMVFAAWVSNKKLPENFILSFDQATGYGTKGDALETVIAQNPIDYFDLREYYNRYLSFDLTVEKKKGLQLFLDMIKANKAPLSG